MIQLFSYDLYSGESNPLALRFYEADGVTPLDLTGQFVGATVKAKPTDPDSAALYKSDVAGNSSGLVEYLIPPLAAGAYCIDVKQWDSAYERSTVIGSQNFSVLQSVTARPTPGGALVALQSAA